MSNQGTVAKDNITAQIDITTNDIFTVSKELYESVRKIEDFLLGPAEDIKPSELQQKESKAEVIPWMYGHKNGLKCIEETLNKTRYHLNHIMDLVQ